VDTTASFSAPGTYVLRLAAGDGELCASDEVTITVTGSLGEITLEIRLEASSDDAEERDSGSMNLTSSDLELVFEGGGDQTVGMRFNGVDIPQGAKILGAHVQFQADEIHTGATELTIQGEDTDHAATFLTSRWNISPRPRTTEVVRWSPVPWTTVGEAGLDQQTPDIASILQEIVDRPGWSSGNSLVIIIHGTGERVAESVNGDTDGAPLLHVEYGARSTDPPAVTDTAPADGSSFAERASIASSRNDAEDGPLTASGLGLVHESATRQISATTQQTPTIAQVRVSSSADDAEEDASGSVDVNSSDLELVFDGSDQAVGMRFNGLDVPQGATILNAFIQLAVDEANSVATSLTIQGEDTGDAATFVEVDHNITSRQRTLTAVPWSPLPWATKGEAGPDQRTPDLRSIVQEIVVREDWTANNSIALILTGTGERTAESYDGDDAAAPLLHVEWVSPTGGPPTGFDLAGTQIEEAAAADTVVGTLVVGTLGAVSDPDVGDSHSFSLPDDAGGRFKIVGDQLQVADGSLLDFETAVSHDITVRVTDSELLFHDETFTITVHDANNEAPYLVAPIADAFALQDEAFSLSVAAHFADDDAIKGDWLTFDATLDDGGPLPSWLSFDPLSVEFSGTPSAADSGDIDVTVTATDDFGPLSVSDTFQLSSTDVPLPTILEVRVSDGLDEVEERFSGVGKSTSRDIEMVDDTTSDFTQTIGIRFNGLNISQGATITSAYVQFHAAEPKTAGELTLQINGEDADHAEPFADTETSIPDFAVSSRPRTDATVDWSPPDWPIRFEAGLDQRTADISSIIEEIVTRPNWTANNSIALIITGSETSIERAAVTYDGDIRDGGNGSTAPLLHVEWVPARCGDGVVQIGVEVCDDGNADDSDACPSSCQAAFCGDGFVQAGVEACDDGNADDSDACLSTCVAASCGDGFVETGVEACDDGNADNGDACLSSCQAAFCGDGFVTTATRTTATPA
jgi:cysteine-rich repeat protein